MGATFSLTESVVANQRQKDDAVNGAVGGCAAGFLAGLRGSFVCLLNAVVTSTLSPIARSLPVAVASCAIIGGAMGIFDYSGALTGDETVTKEERRRRFFKHPPPPLPQPSTV
jgi:hypothetical protein